MADEPLDEHACACKIGRDIDAYSLGDLNEDLVQYRQEHDTSLRDLATYVNHRILEVVIEDASGTVLERDGGLFGALDRADAVGVIYGALHDDDVSPDRRARVRTRLNQAGVELDRVEADWVTHPTVRRHLQECLGIDTSSEQSIDRDNAQDTIDWIRTRCTAIIERTFERLQSTHELTVTDLEISVSIRATCTECGATFRPAQLISRGQCECQLRTDSVEPNQS